MRLHVGDNESERLARKIKMRRDRVMFGKVRVNCDGDSDDGVCHILES